MAECENCIHKKVCSHRANIQTDTYAYMGIKYDTEKCEYYTTDVVPKSEVEALEKEIERLKHILDCYALQYGTVIEQQEVIDKAKAELASEIFAEIENLFIKDNFRLIGNRSAFAELKKKYTEGEE